MPTPIVTTDRQIYRHPKATVYGALRLKEQDFVEIPYLRLEELRLCCAPEIDQAQFTYDYGKILREDAAGPATTHYPPIEMSYLYVKVVITDTVHQDDEEEEDKTVVWYGLIEYDERYPDGSTPDPDNKQKGFQSATAFGLARLAEKHVIRTSLIDVDGDAANKLTAREGLPFNLDPGGYFVQRGNRTAAVPTDSGSHLFSWEPRGRNEWSAYDAVKYLLEYQTPRDTAGNVANTWRLEADADSIGWYQISEQTDGRTLKELLDALIPRYRGVSYWIDFDTTLTDPEEEDSYKNEIVVHVFTFLSDDLTLANGKTFKANPNQYTLDFEHALDIVDCMLGNTTMHSYHRVIARGAKRTTTFTAQMIGRGVYGETSIMLPSWTADDEAEYKAGASGALDYPSLPGKLQQARNSIYRRSSDRLREVFRRFTLNTQPAAVDRWNCKIMHPHSVAADQPEYWLRGDITADPFTAEVDDESDYDGSDYIPGLRIMRGLPFYERKDYSGTNLADFNYGTSFTDQTHPSFIPLMAYARTMEGDAELADATSGQVVHRYELLDRLHEKSFDATSRRDWSCRVHVADTEPAVELVADCAHFLGGPTAGESAEGYANTAQEELGSQHSGLDYVNVWVTMCVELTEHVEQIVDIIEAVTVAANIKIINVPDARHDYVLPHTTVEVKDGLPIETTSGGASRDDRKRLKSIAEAAAKWYGTPRQGLRLQWKQIRGLFQLGWLITDIGSDQKTGVNTPITAITYNMGGAHGPGQDAAGFTRIETSFVNLDLQ